MASGMLDQRMRSRRESSIGVASSTILMALCWAHAVLRCAGDDVILPQGRSQRLSIVTSLDAMQFCIGQSVACCCHDKMCAKGTFPESCCCQCTDNLVTPTCRSCSERHLSAAIAVSTRVAGRQCHPGLLRDHCVRPLQMARGHRLERDPGMCDIPRPPVCILKSLAQQH